MKHPIFRRLAAGLSAFLLAAAMGCSPAESTLEPDAALAGRITEAAGQAECSLDGVLEDWDTVLIDNAYPLPSALEEQGMANHGAIKDLPQQDGTLAVVFLRDGAAVAYALVGQSDAPALAGYQNQLTGEAYPYGTAFTQPAL